MGGGGLNLDVYILEKQEFHPYFASRFTGKSVTYGHVRNLSLKRVFSTSAGRSGSGGHCQRWDGAHGGK